MIFDLATNRIPRMLEILSESVERYTRRVVTEYRRSGAGSYIFAGLVTGATALLLSCAPNHKAASLILPNAGGILLPPTPTAGPVATLKQEITSLPISHQARTLLPGQALLEVIDRGCENGKPTISVLSQFSHRSNDPKVGVLGIRHVWKEKQGKSSPFLLGIVGVNDSSGNGRDERSYQGHALPDKSLKDSDRSFLLADGRKYVMSILPGKVVIMPSGESQVRLIPYQEALAEQTFRAAVCAK